MPTYIHDDDEPLQVVMHWIVLSFEGKDDTNLFETIRCS
jgi:hypothetical protein